MLGAPCTLEVLLHYHVSSACHPCDTAPAFRESTEYLVREGMLKMITTDNYPHKSYITTEKGSYFINHLLDIPFPEARWEIPENTP